MVIDEKAGDGKVQVVGRVDQLRSASAIAVGRRRLVQTWLSHPEGHAHEKLNATLKAFIPICV